VEIPAAHTPGKAVIENIVNYDSATGAMPKYDSVVYCDKCGAEISRTPKTASKRVILGTATNLESSLELLFAVNAGAIPDGGYIVIRKTFSVDKNGNIAEDSYLTIPKDKLENMQGMKIFRYTGLAAKHMSDMFYITVYDKDGNIISVHKDSMRDYIMRQIDSATDANAERFFIDLLNYGAAAQKYFQYGANDLANNKLPEEQQKLPAEAQKGADNRVKGTGYLGTGLALENAIEVQILFDKAVVDNTMRAEITYVNTKGKEVTIIVDGADFVKNGNQGWVVTTYLALTEGMQVLTCTVYDGETAVATAQDSIESYLTRSYDNDALYPAIMQYIRSAKEFFK
jgi:hypothetical protein